jgi:hypothetical protein
VKGGNKGKYGGMPNILERVIDEAKNDNQRMD